MRVFSYFNLAILNFMVYLVLCFLLLFMWHHQGMLGGERMCLLLSYCGKQEQIFKLYVNVAHMVTYLMLIDTDG